MAEEDNSPEEQEEAKHLPEALVKIIAGYLVANDTPGNRLVNVLAMCGVCKQWRGVASELDSGICIGFEGLDNTFPGPHFVGKLRKLSSTQKGAMFLSAAKLLKGYTQVILSGDGITDALLHEIAAQCGPGLQRVEIRTPAGITDAGLSHLLAHSPHLTAFHVDDLPRTCTQGFIATLMRSCRQLTSLHLANISTLNWATAKPDSVNWAGCALTRLHVRGVNLDNDFGFVLMKLRNLTELNLDGPAINIRAVPFACTSLTSLSYLVSCRLQLEEALAALVEIRSLKRLELVVKNFTMLPDHLRVLGMLPLADLRLESFIYQQQPTLTHKSYSHLDNEGVKALVDSVCTRCCAAPEDIQPLKLSLCGATALTHDAVSALLRLPMLLELELGGCCRIQSMDKMRLVAKVRAGREMMESGRRPSMRFPGFIL